MNSQTKLAPVPNSPWRVGVAEHQVADGGGRRPRSRRQRRVEGDFLRRRVVRRHVLRRPQHVVDLLHEGVVDAVQGRRSEGRFANQPRIFSLYFDGWTMKAQILHIASTTAWVLLKSRLNLHSL